MLNDFLLAMILYPEVQRKAQEELARVIGSHRFPTIDDKENLPYLSALCKEVIRWRPVVPMGVTREVLQDEEYNDMLIPKGSMIMINQWCVPLVIFIVVRHLSVAGQCSGRSETTVLILILSSRNGS